MSESTSTEPTTNTQFPIMSRWLDMLDEALEIGTHRK